MPLLRLCLSVLCALCLMLTVAQGEDLPPLNGPVVLTVTGLDPQAFPGGVVEYDVARLESLRNIVVRTSTIWTNGKHSYTGVNLQALTRNLKIQDRMLHFHALNDYAIEFPASEAAADGPILAYKVDGALMSVRDKGPIWVIFPFDDAAKYRTDTIYSRSIWQLDRIDVLR